MEKPQKSRKAETKAGLQKAKKGKVSKGKLSKAGVVGAKMSKPAGRKSGVASGASGSTSKSSGRSRMSSSAGKSANRQRSSRGQAADRGALAMPTMEDHAPVAVRWEYCTLEWLWDVHRITLFLAGGSEQSFAGSYATLTDLLNELGRDCWEVCDSSCGANWVFWTLKRPLIPGKSPQFR